MRYLYLGGIPLPVVSAKKDQFDRHGFILVSLIVESSITSTLGLHEFRHKSCQLNRLSIFDISSENLPSLIYQTLILEAGVYLIESHASNLVPSFANESPITLDSRRWDIILISDHSYLTDRHDKLSQVPLMNSPSDPSRQISHTTDYRLESNWKTPLFAKIIRGSEDGMHNHKGHSPQRKRSKNWLPTELSKLDILEHRANTIFTHLIVTTGYSREHIKRSHCPLWESELGNMIWDKYGWLARNGTWLILPRATYESLTTKSPRWLWIAVDKTHLRILSAFSNGTRYHLEMVYAIHGDVSSTKEFTFNLAYIQINPTSRFLSRHCNSLHQISKITFQ